MNFHSMEIYWPPLLFFCGHFKLSKDSVFSSFLSFYLASVKNRIDDLKGKIICL